MGGEVGKLETGVGVRLGRLYPFGEKLPRRDDADLRVRVSNQKRMVLGPLGRDEKGSAVVARIDRLDAVAQKLPGLARVSAPSRIDRDVEGS